MRKIIIAGLLSAAMILSVTGCGNSSSKSKSETGSKANSDKVTLGEYKSLKMETKDVTEDDINSYVNSNLIEPKKDHKEITKGKVKDGDTVNIDFVGKKDGKAFDGGTAEDTDLAIGSGRFIPGFEEGLLGVKVGETVDLDLTFPKDYTNEELAGQDVVFTVTVNYIQGEEIIPELTDEFVKKNSDYATVEEYKKFAEDTLNQNNQTEAEKDVWKTAMDNAKVSEFDQEELDAAAKNMKDYYTSMAEQYQMEFTDFLQGYFGMTEDQFNEQSKEAAENSVKEIMVSQAILDAEKIEITDKLYKEKVKEYMDQYGFKSEEELEKNVPEEDIRTQITVDLAKQFVVEHAVKK